MNSQEPDRRTSERWQQIKAIVAEALEHHSPEARAAFVQQSCGDDTELLNEVNSLLEQTTGSLENFAQGATESLQRQMSVLEPGRRVGAYRIVRELGRGGMGAVYLAERADGAFEKQVAIKVLKRGTDTDEVLRRFSGERQILARLNHFNIAGLIDAGTTDDGLPYFVMECVIGKAITKFAEENKLSLNERLRLFRVICSAVSYAHQHLVIHRDLKPSNVLVTGDGEIKLLDFGIAKLLDESTPEVTVTLQRRMTPEYASPEQVRGDHVTTVSDVYSLGVLLYEMLTGSRPYKLKTRSAEEITKAIREQEPERPSTAVAKRDGNSKSEIRSSKLLKGDLDNIVLKALRKEPERRYASVEQFSADIRRYLEGLPVRARKDTVGYRARKFVKRHKIGVAAVALMMSILAAGIIVSTIQAQRANRRFEEVRQLAHSLLFDYHDEIAALPGSTKIREKLVKDSQKYLDDLAKTSPSDVALLREMGWAYQRIGEIQGGNVTSRTGGTITFSNLGDTQGAAESFRKALAVRERVAAFQPSNDDVQQELGTSVTRMGEINLTLGKPTDAVNYVRRAMDLYDRLFSTHPSDEGIRAKAQSLRFTMARAVGMPGGANLGKREEAFDNLRTVVASFVALVADFPEKPKYRQALAAEYNQMANVLFEQGKLAEALENHRRALALNEVLLKENATNAFYRGQFGRILESTSKKLLALGQTAEALDTCRRSVGIFESLNTADPADATVASDLAVDYGNLGQVLTRNGDRTNARSTFEKSVTILERLAAKDPANALVSYQQGLAYLNLAEFLRNNGEENRAIDYAQRGARIGEKLLMIDANNAAAQSMVGAAYLQLGQCSAAIAGKSTNSADEPRQHWREARESYEKSLRTYEEMKNRKTLSAADSNQMTQIAPEIAKCDAALAR